MEINLILDIFEALLAGFLLPFRILIENIPAFLKIYTTFNKMSFGSLLCIGIGVPTVTYSIVKFFIKKIVSDN